MHSFRSGSSGRWRITTCFYSGVPGWRFVTLIIASVSLSCVSTTGDRGRGPRYFSYFFFATARGPWILPLDRWWLSDKITFSLVKTDDEVGIYVVLNNGTARWLFFISNLLFILQNQGFHCHLPPPHQCSSSRLSDRGFPSALDFRAGRSSRVRFARREYYPAQRSSMRFLAPGPIRSEAFRVVTLPLRPLRKHSHCDDPILNGTTPEGCYRCRRVKISRALASKQS